MAHFLSKTVALSFQWLADHHELDISMKYAKPRVVIFIELVCTSVEFKLCPTPSYFILNNTVVSQAEP